MCGRYTLRTPAHQLCLSFGVADVPDREPRFNIAPTQSIVCVRRSENGGPEACLMRWGLIPSWAAEMSIGNKLVNARSETVDSKPSFRAAFRHRRCLVLADGFYEWQRVGRAKQPWFFRLLSDEPFAFAGVWESWRSPDGATVESACLLTTTPNEVVAPVHDRMPVMLDPARSAVWLDPVAKSPQLLAMLTPYPAGEMEGYPVSSSALLVSGRVQRDTGGTTHLIAGRLMDPSEAVDVEVRSRDFQ